MSNLERAMVYKSNSLVEASYRLSVAEQRIVLACISQVPRGEPVTDEVMYSVSVQDIAELSETEGQQHLPRFARGHAAAGCSRSYTSRRKGGSAYASIRTYCPTSPS